MCAADCTHQTPHSHLWHQSIYHIVALSRICWHRHKQFQVFVCRGWCLTSCWHLADQLPAWFYVKGFQGWKSPHPVLPIQTCVMATTLFTFLVSYPVISISLDLLRPIHRYHAVPLPCRAAKGLECVFPIWFTQCGRVWFTLAMPMPCPCDAVTIPFSSRPWHSTVFERQPVGYRPAFGFFRLSPEFHEDCYQKHTNPIQWSIPTTVKSGSSTLQKRWSVKLVGLAVRIFPAATRTFTKDMALSEQGRCATWHVWINGTVWQETACYVWIDL